MSTKDAWIWYLEGENKDSFYYETEFAATLQGILEEYGIMQENYYLCRKYEEPTDYHKCVLKLISVNWQDANERNKWKKKHKKSRDLLTQEHDIKPRLVVERKIVDAQVSLKTETYAKDYWSSVIQ